MIGASVLPKKSGDAMRLIRIIAVAFLVSPLMSTVAEAEETAIAKEGRKVRKCLMEVDGKTYINGPCNFARHEEGGGFAIEGLNNRQIDRGIWPWSASVSAEGGFWNNDGGYPASHQHDTFGGPMWREGACWVNARARVCAWK